MPRTNPSCACSVRTHSCLVRFQTFTCKTNENLSSDIMTHWHIPSSMFTLRSCIYPLAVSYLPIAGARQQCGQSCGMLSHAVHSISVSIQRGQERLGKNPIKLGGIQCPRIFSAHLKRMERWIIVSRNWEYKQSCIIIYKLQGIPLSMLAKSSFINHKNLSLVSVFCSTLRRRNRYYIKKG